MEQEKKQSHNERMQRKKDVVDAAIARAQATGEVTFLRQTPAGAGVRYHAMATGFTWNTQNWDADKRAADEAWEQAQGMLRDPAINLVLLDELTYMLKYNYLDTAEVVAAIRARPPMQTVIVTGRAARPELVELADTVSEIADVKHAFKAGVKAQAGIDF